MYSVSQVNGEQRCGFCDSRLNGRGRVQQKNSGTCQHSQPSASQLSAFLYVLGADIGAPIANLFSGPSIDTLAALSHLDTTATSFHSQLLWRRLFPVMTPQVGEPYVVLGALASRG